MLPEPHRVVSSGDGALPMTTAIELERILKELAAARDRIVARRPRDIAAVIARLAEEWTRRGSPWMARAIDQLAAAGPHSRPMLAAALPRMIEPLCGAALDELVKRELGDWTDLDRAPAPRLILHVLPSNMPAHAAIPSALSLLLRSTALLKAGRDDRFFPDLWIASLREIDPEIGACIATAYWPGADRALLGRAMAAADLVVASGSDPTIDAIPRGFRGRFIGLGHRISFAVVGREFRSASTAEMLAQDVAICDQLGCLSPQVCFVEGDRDSTAEFARRVCAALAHCAVSLPASPMSIGEVLDERRFRDAAAWRGYGRATPVLFAVSESPGSGVVTVEEGGVLEPTPLHRCLRMVPIENADRLETVVGPHRKHLEAAGLAVDQGRFEVLADRLRHAGVPHIVRIGEMQRPTLAWQPGGRPRLADWLHGATESSRAAEQ